MFFSIIPDSRNSVVFWFLCILYLVFLHFICKSCFGFLHIQCTPDFPASTLFCVLTNSDFGSPLDWIFSYSDPRLLMTTILPAPNKSLLFSLLLLCSSGSFPFTFPLQIITFIYNLESPNVLFGKLPGKNNAECSFLVIVSSNLKGNFEICPEFRLDFILFLSLPATATIICIQLKNRTFSVRETSTSTVFERL